MKKSFQIIIVILPVLFVASTAYGSPDTLWIGSQVIAPGYDYSFPVFGSLHQSYSGFEIPLTFTSYDLVFDSATLDNTIVPDEYQISMWHSEDSSSAVIFIFPQSTINYDLLIKQPGGRLCNVYFHVRMFAPDQVVYVDTAAFNLYDPDTDSLIKTYSLAGYDENSFALYPEFKFGTIAVSTAADDYDYDGAVPDDFELFQNYPNPFNPRTRIGYALPYETDVILEIYNLLGQRVMSFRRESQKAGYHETAIDASDLGSGFYFYRIRAGDFMQTRKMLLLK